MTQYWKPGTDRESNESIPINQRHGRLPLAHQRSLLPITSHKLEILYAVEKYRLVIIIGWSLFNIFCHAISNDL